MPSLTFRNSTPHPLLSVSTCSLLLCILEKMRDVLIDGIMRVIEDTPQTCVIHNGGSSILTYACFGSAALIIGLTIAGRFSPWMSKRVSHGWATAIPLLFIGVILPAFLAGESNTLTLSRDAGTLRLSTSNFFFFKNTRTFNLRDIHSASVTGKYNQFQINFADGSYLYVGNDTVEGGRATSADAMNAWLNQYHADPAQLP